MCNICRREDATIPCRIEHHPRPHTPNMGIGRKLLCYMEHHISIEVKCYRGSGVTWAMRSANMESLDMIDSVAAIGAMLSALFAAIAAVLSYIQIRANSQANCVPPLNIVGANEVALKISNLGGIAKNMTVEFLKVSGPEVVQMRSNESALRNGIDLLATSEIREFTIAQISNRDYFLHDHQLLAKGIGEKGLPGLQGFQEPVVIRIRLMWQEPGIFWKRSATFDLFVDRPLLDRSTRAQIFPK